MPHSYLPFPQIKNTPAVVVDSFHPNGLVLSHWREAPTPAPLREDTSAGIVLQALKQQWPALSHYRYVTANHFDIDALVGVWALLHPELALAQEQTLRQMALIGDFRELNLDTPSADTALKLVCWLNHEEKTRFYPPFGAGDLDKNEVTASIPKFNFFLEAFARVLLNPEKFKDTWQPEYNQVRQGYAQIHGPQTQIMQYEPLGLVVVFAQEPVHYYALFSPTSGYDVVLACYPGNRFEVECKYTTWVDLESRPTLPRPDLRPLAAKLNLVETSGRQWTADGPTDTGPILRLQGQKLTKAQRYGHPTDRSIYPSSLDPDTFVAAVVEYLQSAFLGISPKKHWTWQGIKKFNEKVQ